MNSTTQGTRQTVAKGKASANPKPPIPAVNCMAPPSEVKEPASNDPKIGPVHEKDTIARVSAIKKIPIIPPTLEALSIFISPRTWQGQFIVTKE